MTVGSGTTGHTLLNVKHGWASQLCTCQLCIYPAGGEGGTAQWPGVRGQQCDLTSEQGTES